MLCSPKALIHQETIISKIWFLHYLCFSDFWALFGNNVTRICPRKTNFLEFILKCFTESHLCFEPKLLLEALYGNAIHNLPSWTLLCLLWINQALKQRIWFCMKYPYPLKTSGRIQVMLVNKILALKTGNGLYNKMAFYNSHLWWTIQTSDLHRLSGTFCSWPLQT